MSLSYVSGLARGQRAPPPQRPGGVEGNFAWAMQMQRSSGQPAQSGAKVAKWISSQLPRADNGTVCACPKRRDPSPSAASVSKNVQAQLEARQLFLARSALSLPLTHTLALFYLCFLYRTPRDTFAVALLHLIPPLAVSDPETRSLKPKPLPFDASLYQTHAHHVLRRRIRWRIRRRSRWRRPWLLERVRKQQCWIRVLQQLDKPLCIVRVRRYIPFARERHHSRASWRTLHLLLSLSRFCAQLESGGRVCFACFL